MLLCTIVVVCEQVIDVEWYATIVSSIRQWICEAIEAFANGGLQIRLPNPGGK